MPNFETILTPGQEILVFTRDGVKPAVFDGVFAGEFRITFHSQQRGSWLFDSEEEIRDVLHSTPTSRGRERLHKVTRK